MATERVSKGNDHRKSLHLITVGLATFTASCGNKMENILMFNLNSKFQVCVNTEILQGYEILFIKKSFPSLLWSSLNVHAGLQFKIIVGLMICHTLCMFYPFHLVIFYFIRTLAIMQII